MARGKISYHVGLPESQSVKSGGVRVMTVFSLATGWQFLWTPDLPSGLDLRVMKFKFRDELHAGYGAYLKNKNTNC